MMDDLELRRRRCAYRCAHRGTKEMDFMLGRYAEAALPTLADPELAHFEEFIALQDPQLQSWLLSPDAIADAPYAAQVATIRKFHGL
jgi:antitoxin CptB